MSRMNAAGCCLVTLLTVLAGGAAREARATDVVATADIAAGTCKVSVSPDRPPFPMVSPDDLRDGSIHGLTPITVHLQDCRGAGPQNTLPSLNIDGNTIPVADNPQGAYLFSDADSQVKSVGFVLSDADTTQWDTAHLQQPGYVTVPGDSPLLGDVDMQYWVGVACGTAASCTDAMQDETHTGLVRASIRFNFDYH